MKGIPRRIQIELLTPEELAIQKAIHAVESLPADTRLSEATVLLCLAQSHVADYVDGIEFRRKG